MDYNSQDSNPLDYSKTTPAARSYAQYPVIIPQRMGELVRQSSFIEDSLGLISVLFLQHMDENNNDSKRNQLSSRSPAIRSHENIECKLEPGEVTTLPPKKSAKHYSRRSTSKTIPAIVNTPNVSPAGTQSGIKGCDSASDKENYCEKVRGAVRSLLYDPVKI